MKENYLDWMLFFHNTLKAKGEYSQLRSPGKNADLGET